MPSGNFIEWRERYSVGNDTINTDHQEIISIINDLYNSLQKHSETTELREILDRLLDYTRQHFEREERLMKKAEYPNLEEHKAKHRELTRKTRELAEQCCGTDADISRETMAFLKNWWIDHIIARDMRYKTYIEKLKSPIPGR